MVEAEARQLPYLFMPYLFKVRQSQGVQLKISQMAHDERWRLLLRLIFKKSYDRIGPKVLMFSLA